MKLPTTISTFTLLSSAIAGMVGSGWLLGPLVCARIAGPAAILTWILAGLLMMVVAFTFIRLSRTMPTTGGTVRFFQLSYGHFAGFSFSWIVWLGWVAVAPIETMALLQYSSHYISDIMTTGDNPVLTHRGILLAIICISMMSIINGYGVKTYSKVNTCLITFKLLIPIMTAVVLMCSHFSLDIAFFSGGFMPYGIQSIFVALPLAGVIYCFIGFNPAIQMAAEAKNPKKSIPIAIIGALVLCILLYTMVQVAFIFALPTTSLAHGWHNLRFANSSAPFVGLLTVFGFALLIKVLYVDAAVSPFGTALVQSMATSRLTLAMAENGYLPHALLKRTSNGSPVRAITVNTIMGFAFFMPFPSWQHMVGFLSSSLVLGYVVGPMSLMILSVKEPGKFSSESAWKTHALCLSALYICNLMIYWSGWAVVSKITMVFVIGYIVLSAMLTLSSNTRKKIGCIKMKEGSWVLLYITGLCSLSYMGTFGGAGYIQFGLDFITMAVFTVTVYCYAYASQFSKSNTTESPLFSIGKAA